jgi:hypothetical protein
VRRAYRAGIEKNIRTAMCGHGFDEVSEEYETPSVSDMATALKKFPRYDVTPAKRKHRPAQGTGDSKHSPTRGKSARNHDARSKQEAISNGN